MRVRPYANRRPETGDSDYGDLDYCDSGDTVSGLRNPDRSSSSIFCDALGSARSPA